MGINQLIVISHRGNINGPDKHVENHPDQIKKAISLGYDVEIDVWYKENQLYLGHDKPQYKVDLTFLKNSRLWCHAKNLKALKYMLANKIKCFWHQEDNFTLTSNGYIWTYPGQELSSQSICVIPEKIKLSKLEIKISAGVCTDYPEEYLK